MANTPPNTPNPNDMNLANLIGIRNELARITDYWHDIAKQNETIGKELGNILQDSQKLNRLLSTNEDIEARIGTELISQSRVSKFQKDLAGQINVSKTKLNNIEQSIKDEHAKVVTSLKSEKALRDSIEAKMDSLIISGKKDAKTKAEINKLAKERESQLKKETILERNKAYVQIELLQQQVRLGEKAKKNAEGLTARVLINNEKLGAKKFGANILKRPLAVLGIGEKQFESFKQFGILGGSLTIAAGIIKKIVELMFAASQQITDIRKGFNLTNKEAVNLRGYFKDAANITKGVLLTQEDIFKAQEAIRDATGTTAVNSKENLNILAGMLDTLHLSEEATRGLAQASAISGKSYEQIRNTVLGTAQVLQLNNKVQLDNKKILDKVLSASGEIRANFRGNVEELAKAVTNTERFGTSLEAVQKTAEGLLDFENSISSQLEAELLTNKHINMERARAAALSGDTNQVMTEVVKQVGSLVEFNSMNVIQQQQLAKAFSMTRGELSDMLIKAESIKKLSRLGAYDTTKTIEQNYELLKKQGISADKINEALGEQVAANLEAQSAGERFAKVLTKLQDIISNLFDGGILQKFISGFAGAVQSFSKHGFFGGLGHIGEESRAIQNSMFPDGMPVPKAEQRTNRPTSMNPTPQLAPVAAHDGKLAEVMRENNSLLKQMLQKEGKVTLDSRPVGTVLGLGYSAFA